MSSEQYVLKLSNGHGHVEWYRSLGSRPQAETKAGATRFSKAEADERALKLPNFASAFSGAFYNNSTGQYDFIVEVLPADGD